MWLRATKHFLVPRELGLYKLHLVVRLVVHIVSDLVFIEPHSGDKVPSLPQRTVGELLRLFLEPGAGFPLQYLDNVGNRILGWYRKVQVEMLVSHVPCADTQSFPSCDHLEDSLELLFNEPVREHFSTVLRTPDYVVLTIPRGVGLEVQSSVHW